MERDYLLWIILNESAQRLALAAGWRQRRFAEVKLSKLLENAQAPTSWVHAVLGGFLMHYSFCELGEMPSCHNDNIQHYAHN
jgi:hypothetical protein